MSFVPSGFLFHLIFLHNFVRDHYNDCCSALSSFYIRAGFVPILLPLYLLHKIQLPFKNTYLVNDIRLYKNVYYFNLCFNIKLGEE